MTDWVDPAVRGNQETRNQMSRERKRSGKGRAACSAVSTIVLQQDAWTVAAVMRPFTGGGVLADSRRLDEASRRRELMVWCQDPSAVPPPGSLLLPPSSRHWIQGRGLAPTGEGLVIHLKEPSFSPLIHQNATPEQEVTPTPALHILALRDAVGANRLFPEE